jgi:cytoskeletal protein CcmA (bactofilin family)
MDFFKNKTPINTFHISQGISINGGLVGDISGRIEGYVKGDVIINGKVIIAETGVIDGNLKCYDLIVHGIIKGSAVCHNSVIVGVNGRIDGNVSSNSIQIDSNSKVSGTIKKINSIEKKIESVENLTNTLPSTKSKLIKHSPTGGFDPKLKHSNNLW